MYEEGFYEGTVENVEIRGCAMSDGDIRAEYDYQSENKLPILIVSFEAE